MPKAHLYQTEDPHTGQPVNAICGEIVTSPEILFMWDEQEMGLLNLSRLRVCGYCVQKIGQLDERFLQKRSLLYAVREKSDAM